MRHNLTTFLLSFTLTASLGAACHLPWGANVAHGQAAAQPAPKAPPAVKVPDVSGDPGTFIVIVATADAPAVKWVLLDTGLSLFPPNLLKDAKTAVVIGQVPGKYRILAYSGNAEGPSEPAVATVTVNGPVPPPVPPTPPTPTDPFTQAVLAAYAQETDAGKRTSMMTSAAVFTAEVSRLASLANVGAFNKDLVAQLTAADPGPLPRVTAIVQAELKASFGTDNAAPLNIPAAQAELNKIATALRVCCK